MRRLKVAVAVVGITTIALAGCAQNGGSGSPSTTSTIGTANKVEDPTAKGPAAEIPGAVKGGIVNVYNGNPPDTFDPTDIYYTDSNEIGKLVYRTPTQFDIRDGQPVLVPDLTDLGTVSADGLTWTFKMTGSFKYEDGSAVKVEDLAYAVKRSFAHDVFDEGPAYQLQYFKDADTYEGPYTSGDDYAGVETSGTDTLIIHLATAFPDLPFYMTFPVFTPIPEAKDNGKDYGNHPLATGPYKYKSDWDGTTLDLVKNDQWDANSDPVRHQYPDEFIFSYGKDDIVEQQAIVAGGEGDQTSIDYADLDASVVQDAKAGGYEVTGDSPCTIGFNIDTRKITDINVRKAIALAFPYDDYYKAAGLNPETFTPATTILPPSVPGYTQYTPWPGQTGSGNGDPVAAKAALTAANALGYEISWYYRNDTPTGVNVEQVEQTAFEAAGFKVNAIGVDGKTPDYRKDKANYDISVPVNTQQTGANWCSDWPTGGSWFPVMFQSHSIDDGISWGFLQDSALDAEIDANAAKPADEAAAGWGAIDQEITGKYVGMPLYYTKAAIAVGKKIGGVVIDGTVGMPFFPDVYVKA